MTHPAWLILGGGLHGVHLAIRLIAEAKIPREQIRILDPEPELLGRWKQRTAATGMKFLRSPSVHHLGHAPFSLLKFAGSAKTRRKRARELFAAPYDRPSLRFFNDHCDALIEQYQLKECHVQGLAKSITAEETRMRATTEDGQSLGAEHVVLALGVEETPAVPSWVPANESRVQHLFAMQPGDSSTLASNHVVVIGGGVSAVQAALKEARAGRTVTLVSRHSLRKHQFDSDPGWLGPKFMRRFERERSMDRRRKLIEDARHKGSVPPDLHLDLQLAIREGRLVHLIDEVESLFDTGEALELHLTRTKLAPVDRVILATGLQGERPGGDLVDQLIVSESLACADCGYPLVDHHLRWHPRVFVTGALAELELGPASRNISGARRAGERIVAFANRTRSSRPAFTAHTRATSTAPPV